MTPRLDYVEETSLYVLRTGGALDPATVMTDYGLDLSAPMSTPSESVLYTHQPYAAAAFSQWATPQCRSKLDWIIKAVDASWAMGSTRHFDLPADEELHPYQQGSIAYALDRPHCLIADEPGLGKTVEAIVIANEIRAKRVLVICPAQVRYQWMRQIQRWSTMAGATMYAITSSKFGVHPTANWTVISFELACSPGILRALVAQQFDLLVIDEAHKLKNSGTQRTHAVFGYADGRVRIGVPEGKSRPKIIHTGEEVIDGLAARCEKIVCLTGTPLPNRPRECYTLARHLAWESIDFASEDDFRFRFNPSEVRTGTRLVSKDDGSLREEEYTWTDERSGRHAELQNRLRTWFMARHLKADVLTQLKPPVYDLVYVDENTAAIRAALEAEKLLDIDPENLEGKAFSLGGDIPISTARRLMGEALAPWAAQYIELLLDGGEPKIVVFAHHHSVMDELQTKLARFGVVRVDGRTSPKAKQRLVDEFIKNPGCRVILGELVSLGTGTDGLQEVCGRAVIAEPDWVPGNNVQAFDRLHRDGQTRTVFGDIIVCKGSFAEKILVNALRKLRVQYAALDRRVVV